MTRVYTVADIESLASAGTSVLTVAPGELISPAALDVAASRGIEVRRGAPADVAVPAAPNAAEEECEECSCHLDDAVTTMLRDVVRSVAAANPNASSETIAQETLKALGAGGGVSIGSPEQARPAGNRILPAKAKGARPVFFEDDGATDAVLSIVTSLASEVWALRERIDTLERLLAAKGTIAPGAVDAYRPEGAVVEERDAEAAAYVARVYRVFDELREQINADETWDGYMEVVRRAFAEL